jgi:UDP-glucuronate 4-epimerase
MIAKSRGYTRALVTGSAGFIGSHLTESLLRDGIEVVGIDCFNDNYGREQKLRNMRHLSDWSSFQFVPIDLARGDLEEFVRETDVVFHLAAEPGVRSSWGQRYSQYLRNNILATQHLLEAAKAVGSRRIVYASSSSIYGNALQRPTAEDTPAQPRSPYGQTKLAMEHLCSLYRENFGVDSVGLRYFTVFGPRQRPDMAFHRICRALLLDEEFHVFGDGRQTRDFTFVGDIVAATRASADAELDTQQYPVFNVGGGSPASLREVIEILERITEKRLMAAYDDSEPGDVRDTEADTSRARAHLEYAPSTTLQEGLAAECAWMAEYVQSNDE